jgi:hypothetical protein
MMQSHNLSNNTAHSLFRVGQQARLDKDEATRRLMPTYNKAAVNDRYETAKQEEITDFTCLMKHEDVYELLRLVGEVQRTARYLHTQTGVEWTSVQYIPHDKVDVMTVLKFGSVMLYRIKANPAIRDTLVRRGDSPKIDGTMRHAFQTLWRELADMRARMESNAKKQQGPETAHDDLQLQLAEMADWRKTKRVPKGKKQKVVKKGTPKIRSPKRQFGAARQHQKASSFVNDGIVIIDDDDDDKWEPFPLVPGNSHRIEFTGGINEDSMSEALSSFANLWLTRTCIAEPVDVMDEDVQRQERYPIVLAPSDHEYEEEEVQSCGELSEDLLDWMRQFVDDDDNSLVCEQRALQARKSELALPSDDNDKDFFLQPLTACDLDESGCEERAFQAPESKLTLPSDDKDVDNDFFLQPLTACDLDDFLDPSLLPDDSENEPSFQALDDNFDLFLSSLQDVLAAMPDESNSDGHSCEPPPPKRRLGSLHSTRLRTVQWGGANSAGK